MSATALRPTARERRLARQLAARREPGLVEALLELKGVRFGSRYECVSLYAIGGEGAVFLARDLFRDSPLRVAKIALLPFHRPFELDAATVSKRRAVIEVEARYLAGTGGTFLPKHLGTYDFRNPLLDPARGGVFAEPGTAIVMERLPGHDLDRWLARAHRSEIPPDLLRPALDGVSAMLLHAVAELLDRGLLYADLRPANLRMLPRPQRHARLLDAGSLVTVYDRSGRFPHVPAYLPPHMLAAQRSGETVLPSPAVQTVMAGRTLYEVATGSIPRPGEEIDEDRLHASPVSRHVAESIAALARGEFADAREALASLGAAAPGPQPTPSARAAPRRAGPGIGYGASVRGSLRRRRRARRSRLEDGLRALRDLARLDAPAAAAKRAAEPADPPAPADDALIEVPPTRLIRPSHAVDESVLRAGLSSPAVADAIGRLARGEFRDPEDALRYARTALPSWASTRVAPAPPRGPARPPSPAAAPERAGAPPAPRPTGLVRRIVAAVRRLVGRTRA